MDNEYGRGTRNLRGIVRNTRGIYEYKCSAPYSNTNNNFHTLVHLHQRLSWYDVYYLYLDTVYIICKLLQLVSAVVMQGGRLLGEGAGLQRGNCVMY